MKTGTVYATDQHGLTDAIEDAMEYTGLVKLRDPNYEIDKDLLKKSCVEYELDLKNRGIYRRVVNVLRILIFWSTL